MSTISELKEKIEGKLWQLETFFQTCPYSEIKMRARAEGQQGMLTELLDDVNEIIAESKASTISETEVSEG